MNTTRPRFSLAGLFTCCALLSACGASDPEVVGVESAALGMTTCWAVTGWSSPGGPVGSQALLTSTSCLTIPQGMAWIHITNSYAGPPPDEIWLRIPLTDSHMSGYQFSPLLVFSGYNGAIPIIFVDMLVGNGGNTTLAGASPPLQGTPNAGSIVRLRHQNTAKCIKAAATNGGQAFNVPCNGTDAGQTFVLDDAGAGTFRLRGAQTGQCLYTTSTNGAAVYNWGCWADPAMRFNLVSTTGGYRLQHVNTSQCVYGNSTNGGVVHSWQCWNDPNMTYNVDIISYGTVWGPLPEVPGSK